MDSEYVKHKNAMYQPTVSQLDLTGTKESSQKNNDFQPQIFIKNKAGKKKNRRNYRKL